MIVGSPYTTVVGEAVAVIVVAPLSTVKSTCAGAAALPARSRTPSSVSW